MPCANKEKTENSLLRDCDAFLTRTYRVDFLKSFFKVQDLYLKTITFSTPRRVKENFVALLFDLQCDIKVTKKFPFVCSKGSTVITEEIVK